MRRFDAAAAAAAATGVALWGVALTVLAAEPVFRHSAPITVQRSAAFVQLPLPASAYGRSLQGLQDLRVVDARGERVPFALLAPRAGEAQTTELQRDATLYPLPRKPAAGQPWASPVEVLVQGDRISVKRLGGTAASSAPAGSPGWLIDLGERQRDDPPPRSLRMAWAGPAEFSAPFDIETSADLRTWRAAGRGQLMALAGAAGPLTQPVVVLSEGAARFIRLVWMDASAAPTITGARLVMPQQRTVALDAPSELQFTASPEPAGKPPVDDAARRALHFDLGGALPLVEMDVQLTAGAPPAAASAVASAVSARTAFASVVPARVQGRNRADEPWRDLTPAVFYRLERDGVVSRSPPVPLNATVRYVRLLPDERAAALDPASTRLVVRAQLATLVMAAQGQPPWRLLAGSPDARPGALPATTLVPALEEERPRFGQAVLGDWSEVAEVARQAEADQRQAALRPWLLWAVLLAGVAVLGFMVWRLAQGRART